MPIPFLTRRCLPVFVVLMVFTSVLDSVVAEEHCLKSALNRLQTDAKSLESFDWDEAPSAIALRLPIQFQDVILSNPRTIELKKRFGDGANLGLHVDYYDIKVERGERFWMTGETVQAIFLKRILETIFPKATFIEDAHAPSFTSITGKKVPSAALEKMRILPLYVIDSAESGREVDWRKAGVPRLGSRAIQMSLLKAANPGPALQARSQLRDLLNLPPDIRIVSLYASMRTRTGAVTEAARQLVLSKAVDYVIVSGASSGLHTIVNQSAGSTINLRTSEAVTKQKLSGKTLLINDSRGRMPFIHGAADVSLVLGSPNIFEPLNAGTPTVFFRKPEPGFEAKTWAHLVKLAEETHGGFGVSTIEEAISLIETKRLSSPARSPASIADHEGFTAVDKLLTNIKNAME